MELGWGAAPQMPDFYSFFLLGCFLPFHPMSIFFVCVYVCVVVVVFIFLFFFFFF